MKPYPWQYGVVVLTQVAALAALLADAVGAHEAFVIAERSCLVLFTNWAGIWLLSTWLAGWEGPRLSPGHLPRWKLGWYAGWMALWLIWRFGGIPSDLRHGYLIDVMVFGILTEFQAVRITQNGIFYYGGVIWWEQVEAYTWEQGRPSTQKGEADILCLTARLSWPFLVRRRKQPVRLPIRVRATQKEAVERLLALHAVRAGQP